MNFGKELENLRKMFVVATPKQRINAAKARMKDSSYEANLLIQGVSACEAVARSLILHLNFSTKDKIWNNYDKYCYKSPESLIEEEICKKLRIQIMDYLSSEDWENFKFAVKFRNVVVHECTYLGQNKSGTLLKATEKVFNFLEELERKHFN